MNPCQKAVRKATSLTGKTGSWRPLRDRIWCFLTLAAFISLVVFGCDLFSSREARKMDEKIVSSSMGESDSLKQSSALIPPIDLVDPPQRATATFALG